MSLLGSNKKTAKGGGPSTVSVIYLLLVFFRLERAEPASVFVVLLLEDLERVLLATVATFRFVAP